MIHAPLLRLEIRETARQRLTWIVLGLLLFTMIVGSLSGAARVEAQRETLARVAAQAEAAVADAQAAQGKFGQPANYQLSPFRDPTDAASYMNYFMAAFATKSPAPLSALSAGQSDLQPAFVRINFGNPFPDSAYELRSPRILALGAFDLGFVLVYLVPLALIALGGTRLAREQDNGILRMIAAQPVSPKIVAAAKFGALAVVTVPLIVGGALLTPLVTGGIGAGASGVSLVILAALIALYCLFWIAFCALAASLWRGAAAALTALILAWALMTVFVPALGTVMLDVFLPPPSRLAYIDETRVVSKRLAEAQSVGPEWFAKRPDLKRINPDAADSSEIDRFARASLTRQHLMPSRHKFEAHLNDVESATELVRLLSPALVLDGVLQKLSGNDVRSYSRLFIAADDYSQRLRRWFEPMIVANIGKPPTCEACPGRLNFDEYESVPAFEEAPHRTPTGSSAWAILYLLGAVAAAWLVTARRLCRWPV